MMIEMHCTRPGCSTPEPCPACAALVAEARNDALRVILDHRFQGRTVRLHLPGSPCDPS